MTPLSNLNSEQQLAASSSSTEIIVSAGAGSGKTYLLVGRYLHLLRSDNYPVGTVAAITFTEKAAAKMKHDISKRARELATDNPEKKCFWTEIADSVYGAPISTIHAFCNVILRTYPRAAGIDPGFAIIDKATDAEIMNETIDRFMDDRMTAEPEMMIGLMEHFGYAKLRTLYKALLQGRAKLLIYLDRQDTTTPESLERIWVAHIENTLRSYHERLKWFHALAPDGDKIGAVIAELTGSLGKILSGICRNNFNTGEIRECVKLTILKGGSGKKWAEAGCPLSDVKDKLKELRIYLDSAADYFSIEHGKTASVVHRLIEEYLILEHRYTTAKKNRSLLGHDDTLIETWRLLRNNPSVVMEVSRSYKHILVDEFQDTDPVQMDILRMITGNSDVALFTVGDVKQSIYRFRGADVSIFKSFETGKNVDFFHLALNYRSTPIIVGFLNALFMRIMGRDIGDTRETIYTPMKANRKDPADKPGVEIIVCEADTVAAQRRIEAGAIANRIRVLIDSGKYDYNEIAILFRRSSIVETYEESLLSCDIPYINLTAGKPFESDTAIDIANLLSWLVKPEDPAYFSALLISPFFNVPMETLAILRARAGTAADMPRLLLGDDALTDFGTVGESLSSYRRILLELLDISDRTAIRTVIETAFDRTGYTLTALADPVAGDRKLAIVDFILDTADAFETGGGDIRTFTRLLTSRTLDAEDTPQVESSGKAVSLLTIHKAKGLEFKVVFLADTTGTTSGNTDKFLIDHELGPGFRLRRAGGEPLKTYTYSRAAIEDAALDHEESKRLFYVACTRAMERLVILGKARADIDDTYEGNNWMAWIHSALSISAEGEPGPDSPLNLYTYTRISTDTFPLPESADETWRKALSFDGVVPDNFITDGILVEPPPPPNPSPPATLSPTGIADYVFCPALYRYRHVYGLTGEVTVGGSGGMGPKYGIFAHRVLERWDGEPSSLRETLDSCSGPTVFNRWKERAEREMTAYAHSDLMRRIRDSAEVRREEPFAFECDEVIVRGTLDICFREGDSHIVVDYKTDRVEFGGVDDAVSRYITQVGIYGLAVEKAFYEPPRELILYFLAPGTAWARGFSPEWRETVTADIHAAISGITASEFAPKPSERCAACPYEKICGAGVPT